LHTSGAAAALLAAITVRNGAVTSAGIPNFKLLTITIVSLHNTL
jgi:hypothetical protein